MAKYIDNNSNITFNNVSEIGTSLNHVPVSKKNNYTFNDDETEITAINSKVLNAVDIDWNDADFANASAPSSEPTTINTSGDLIKDIKWASTVGSGSGGGHGQMGVTGAQGIHGISS